LKNEKQKEKVVDDEIKRVKCEANTERKKDTTPNEGKEVPYPLVPSRKEKERHLARFLDIFKKLEITLPHRWYILYSTPTFNNYSSYTFNNYSSSIHGSNQDCSE